MRSLLFVPSNDAKRIESALTGDADAVILDLGDTIPPLQKPAARELVAAALKAHKAATPKIIIRINALEPNKAASEDVMADLAAIMPMKPHCIMLPKCVNGADIQHLAALLAVAEAEAECADGATRIIALAPQVPAALFNLGSFAQTSQRLMGIAWAGESFAPMLGAQTNTDDAGNFTQPYHLARSLTLFAANAAEVMAIDCAFSNVQNLAGFKAETYAAKRDGFTAKITLDPAQISLINRIFTPSEAECDKARRIIAAFEAEPDYNEIWLDGEVMVRHHLIKAHHLLAQAKAAGLSP